MIGTKKTRTRQRPNFRNRLSELEEKINNSNSDATPRSDYDHEDVNKNLINETKASFEGALVGSSPITRRLVP